jgi:hypothetical protein
MPPPINPLWHVVGAIAGIACCAELGWLIGKLL